MAHLSEGGYIDTSILGLVPWTKCFKNINLVDFGQEKMNLDADFMVFSATKYACECLEGKNGGLDLCAACRA